MSSQMSEEKIYEEARKRVEEKKGFFIHLAVYIIINTLLVFIWLMTGAGFPPWFIYPLLGWGIGLLFHFLGVFVFSRRTGWERKAIEKEVERIKKEGS